MVDPFSLVASVALSVAISAIVSFLFPAEGPRLKDLSVSSSAYGNTIPEVWGTCRVGGNMIWSSNIKEHKHKKKVGLSSYNQYTYTADFAMAWCKGPVQAIRRIWANGKIIYDVTGNSSQATNGKYRIAIYNGTEEQMPDGTISSYLPGATPGYRGTCYVVFKDFQLEDYGNQLPQMAAEVFVSGDSSLIPLSTIDLSYSHSANDVHFDFDRQLGYAISGQTIHQYSLKSGGPLNDRSSSPTYTPSGFYDGGNVNGLLGVDSSGNALVNCGGITNNSSYGVVDRDSLSLLGRAGNNTPFGSYWIDDPDLPIPPHADRMLIPYGGSGVFNASGDTFLLATQFGELWILYPSTFGFDKTLEPPSIHGDKIEGNYGGLYNSRYFCSQVESGWFVAWNDGSGTVINLQAISEQSSGVVMDNTLNQSFTVSPPNPGDTNFEVRGICCDTTGVILFAHSDLASYAIKYSTETESVVWVTKLPGGAPSGEWRGQRLDLNVVAWFASGKVWILNTSDGTWVNRAPDQNYYVDNDYVSANDIQYVNPGESGYSVSGLGGLVAGTQTYDGRSGLLILSTAAHATGHTLYVVAASQYGSVSVTLEFILRTLLERAGLEPSDYDLSDLESTSVRGYGFGSPSDIKSVISELQQIFLFDFLERDGKLVGRMRGSSNIDETINYKVLGNSSNDSGGDTPDYWKETRLSEADIPSSISLKYMNIDQDFEQNTAVSKRILAPIPEVFSRQQDTVEAAIVFDGTEAKNRANAMLYTAWAERTKHNTRLPLAYSYLEPADVLSVNMADSRNYIERINETQFGADFSMTIETYGQDSGAYLFNMVGSSGNGMGQEIQVPVPARPFIINTPYLRDIDVLGDGKYSIYYQAIGNDVRKNFNGATLYVSADDGGSFDIAQTFPKDIEWGGMGSVIGGATHGDFGLDWETKVVVWPAIDAFELSSVTDDDLWNGANYFVIGNEVLQFRDAVDNGDGSWTLSNLLRGRRGTEWAIDTHDITEKVVFLDGAVMDIGQEPLDAKGKSFIFKAVGTGRELVTAPEVDITYVPRDLMPYAPVQLSAAWDGGDIKVSFQRRTRWNGNMQDGTGIVPLNEATEAYEMDIYDGDTVIRTISVDYGTTPLDNPYVTYTATMQEEDFSIQPVLLTVELFQMSAAVGRGFGTKTTLTISGTAAPTARYWGASASTSLTESDILALGGEDLSNDFVKSITYDCTGGKYPYFCFPASYGTPSHVKVNGLPFSAFTQTTQTVGGNSYHVIRFDLLQHGNSIPTDWA